MRIIVFWGLGVPLLGETTMKVLWGKNISGSCRSTSKVWGEIMFHNGNLGRKKCLINDHVLPRQCFQASNPSSCFADSPGHKVL